MRFDYFDGDDDDNLLIAFFISWAEKLSRARNFANKLTSRRRHYNIIFIFGAGNSRGAKVSVG